MTVEGADPLVVWQAGVSWDAVVGTDRQLATHLAATGVDVLWVDPPLSIVHVPRPVRLRSLSPSAETVAPAVTRLTIPVGPFPERRGMHALTRRYVDRVLRRRVGDARRPAAVIATAPQSTLRLLPTDRRVYYATDDFVAGAALMGRSAASIRRLERARIDESDEVGAITPDVSRPWVEAGWLDGARMEPFTLPNGCDAARFAGVDDAPYPDDVTLRGPIAGVVGQLSERIDIALLEAIASSGLALLIVGPRLPDWAPGRFEQLAARDNVQWVGPKPHEDLPSYLRVIDVGLTPYADTPFNRASFPLKTLEYLAAGRAALSTPLPAVDALATDLVVTASGPAAFAEAAARLAAQPRSDADAAARRAFAQSQSWDVRAVALRRILGLGEP